MQEQIETHAIGLVRRMDHRPDRFLAMLERLFSCAFNRWTILTGIQTDREEDVAKGGIAAAGDAPHAAPVAAIILFHIKAG